MSAAAFDSLLQTAREQGLVPHDAQIPAQAARPWPVVLLTALGAWLAAIPLLVVVGMLLGDLISRSAGPYIVGALMVAGSIVVLRSRDLPLFVEQLAVPALLVGVGALGFGLFRDAGNQGGAMWLGVLVLGIAFALRAPWLRVLLGAAAMLLFSVALVPERLLFTGDGRALQPQWLSIHVLLVVWLLVHAAQRWHVLTSQAAAAVESIAAGWALALLATLALWSGMTFLVGGALGGGLIGEIAREVGHRDSAAPGWRSMEAVSAVLALAGMFVAARRWPGLRHPAWIGAGLVLVALAALMPTLGATLLMLALLATSGRFKLAIAAGVAAAWIVGAFYYQLAWPLSTKAAVMAGAGALLGGLARWAGAGARSGGDAAGAIGQHNRGNHAGARDRPTGVDHAAAVDQPSSDASVAAPARASSRARIAIALSAAAVLVVANLGIWQKEMLIRDGRRVFVELAPVDPRSLMAGDFMRLNFNVPGAPVERRSGLLRQERPRVVAQLDARGIAKLVRIDQGQPLAQGEVAIELAPKDGHWTLVSDAWFFAEGEAQRWQGAKYGEFRVDSAGRALLVGLRGPGLEVL